MGAAALEPSAPPLPVVLVHGLGDSDSLARSNLRFLAQWLRQGGHPVRLAPSDEEAPLLDNVATLRRAVAEAKAASGSEQVLLIAHSFGGLIARAYLSGGATDVAGLATLGTPHAGVRLAYDFIVSDLARGSTSASQIALLPEHRALLAPFSEPGSVPQLHIGGDRLPDENLFAGFPPHDGIVSAASATAAPGATRVLPLLHGWSFQTLAFGIDSLLWPDNIYVNIIRPWMQSVQRGEPWQDRAATPPLASPGFTTRPLLARPLAPDERVTLSVALDGQPATWFLQGEGVTLDLVAPDGRRYPGERFLLGDHVAHLPYRDNVLQPLDLWSTREEPGTWQALLHNTSAAPVAARLSLVEPLAVPLELVLEQTWHASGSTVLVEARGAAGQPLFATLDRRSLPMIELAPGQYRAVMTAPRGRGYYALRVGNERVERWGVVGVQSEAWQVRSATLATEAGSARLRLVVEGEGEVALGARLLRGEEVLATRLVGPFRFRFAGEHALSVALPLPSDASDLRVEWQLFDQRGGLLPATGISQLPIEK